MQHRKRAQFAGLHGNRPCHSCGSGAASVQQTRREVSDCPDLCTALDCRNSGATITHPPVPAAERYTAAADRRCVVRLPAYVPIMEGHATHFGRAYGGLVGADKSRDRRHRLARLFYAPRRCCGRSTSQIFIPRCNASTFFYLAAVDCKIYARGLAQYFAAHVATQQSSLHNLSMICPYH